MLESFRKGQRWLTLIFVSVIGLVFVFFFGVGGSFGPPTPTGNSIVELDDIQLTSRDFGREQQQTEARLRAQLGDAYDQVGADRYVDSQALSSLINNAVLATAAREMGLHVTKDEVRRVVQASPAFIDAEGRFSPAAFNNFAQREYGTQRSFIRHFTRTLLGQKLVQLLASQTTVSDAEVDLATRFDLEEVRIAYVVLDETRLPDGETISDEMIEAYANENEEALRATFAEREEALSSPERVRARHLLVLVPADASDEEEEAARARAEAARARIEAGEAFAAVASEVSEDVGTKAEGGDLGLFAHGDNDPAVDAAAFALEPGELSQVVRSSYGFHVIQVDEKQPAEPADFARSRLDLAREAVSAERARELAITRGDALARRILDGASLEDAAREEGLSLERTVAFKRRPDGFIPGLRAAPDMMTTAFTLEAGATSSEVFDLGGRRALLQVIERNAPDADTIASERTERRPQVLTQKQNERIDTWLTDYRRELERSGRLLVNAELALGS